MNRVELALILFGAAVVAALVAGVVVPVFHDVATVTHVLGRTP